MNRNTKKLALSGIFIAIAVVFSAFSIPIGVAKVFPVQHLINIVGGVILGPFYALGIAFATSLIRVLIGTGSLLAFPGSVFGAFLSGYLYKRYGTLLTAFLGEVVGTGIIGALCSYPIALFIMEIRKRQYLHLSSPL